MPDAYQPSLARIACPGGCRGDRTHGAHHDRLLAVETDPDAVVDLFDLAVTWHELEYEPRAMVAPQRWMEFAARHRWQNPERVARIFGLATDIAMRAVPAVVPDLSMASGSDLCPALNPAPTPSRSGARLRIAVR